jgi:hypothetical protein
MWSAVSAHREMFRSAIAAAAAKPAGLPRFERLSNVLLRVATRPQSLMGQLTPQRWAETFGRQAVA